MRSRCLLLAACCVAVACGGDDDVDTSRAAFVDWLTTEGDVAADEAECVADEMYDDLSPAEVEEFVTLDADMTEEEFAEAEPSRLDDYTAARLACVD